MTLPARINKLEAQATRRAIAVNAVPIQPLPLRSPSDVVDLLATEVEAVRRDARIDPVEKARTIGMLAAVALRAMEAAASDGRIEAIERVLKLRRESQRSKGAKD